MEHIGKTLREAGLKGSKNPSREKISYDCPICRDCGFVHPLDENNNPIYSEIVRCVCKKDIDDQERRGRFKEICNLPTASQNKTFETFDTYGEKNLIEVKELSLAVARGSDEIKSLTLLGESDRGKSHLAVAICREWLEHGKAARYAKTSNLLDELRDYVREDALNARLNFLFRIGLLVLDDFGTEKMTEWGAEQFQAIIDYRYDNELHTVVTSNRPVDDLFNYDDHPREKWRDLANMRIGSRLQRETWCRVVVITGQEHMLR